MRFVIGIQERREGVGAVRRGGRKRRIGNS